MLDLFKATHQSEGQVKHFQIWRFNLTPFLSQASCFLSWLPTHLPGLRIKSRSNLLCPKTKTCLLTLPLPDFKVTHVFTCLPRSRWENCSHRQAVCGMSQTCGWLSVMVGVRDSQAGCRDTPDATGSDVTSLICLVLLIVAILPLPARERARGQLQIYACWVSHDGFVTCCDKAQHPRPGDEAEEELVPSSSRVGTECSFLPLGHVISRLGTIPVPEVFFSFSLLEATVPFHMT